MSPIHGKQIHFCVGTGHEKFSRLVGTIRTCPVLLIRSVYHARFTNAMVTALVHHLLIYEYVYVGVDFGVDVGVNVGVDVHVDFDAGVIFIGPRSDHSLPMSVTN